MAETAQQTDPRRQVYDVLASDDNYKNFIPKDFNTFAEKMASPEAADQVYQVLLKDKKYKSFLPDSAKWASTFIPVETPDVPVETPEQVTKSKKKESTVVDSGEESPTGGAPSEDIPDQSGQAELPEDNRPPIEQATSTLIRAEPETGVPEIKPRERSLADEIGLEVAEPIKAPAQQIEDKLIAELDDRAKNIQEQIVLDAQAEFDAGNLTEEEANAKIQEEYAKEYDSLQKDINAQYQEQILDLQEAELDKLEKDTLNPIDEPDTPSRVTGQKLVTQTEMNEAKQNVRDAEETRKTINKIATEQLEVVQQNRRVSSGLVGDIGDALFDRTGKERRGTRTQDEEYDEVANEILRYIKRASDDDAGFGTGLFRDAIGLVGFTGSIWGAMQDAKKRGVLKKPQNERTEAEQRLVDAIALMNTFDRAGVKPNSVEVGEMLNMMIPFVQEFVVTGKPSEAVGLKVGTGLMKSGVPRGLFNYTVRGTSVALTQAALNPQRWVRETQRRMTPVDVAILDLDTQEISEIVRQSQGESGGTAVWKAGLTHLSEMITERLGFAYGDGFTKFMKSKAAKQVISPEMMAKYTFSQFAKRNNITSAKTLKDVIKRTGVNNVFSEVWGEELPNMALNELITGDRGIGFWESLDPTDPELMKMIVPMLIMQGAIYAPSVVQGGFQYVKSKKLDKAVAQREEAISKIRNNSVIEVPLKNGNKKKFKRIEGKWKAQNKKGTWVSATEAQQSALDNAYVAKKEGKATEPAKPKLKTTTKEDGTVVTEKAEVDEAAAKKVLEQEKRKTDGTTKKETTKEGKPATENKETETTKEGKPVTAGKNTKRSEDTGGKEAVQGKVEVDEVEAPKIKKGDTITAPNGKKIKVAEITKVTENGINNFVMKGEDGSVTTVGEFSVLKKEVPPAKTTKGGKPAKPAANKPAATTPTVTTTTTKPAVSTTKPAGKKTTKPAATETTETEPVKTEPKKPLKSLGDPNSLQNELSSAKQSGNKIGELYSKAKDKGWISKKTGKPTKKGLENGAKNIYDAKVASDAKIEAAQKAYDASVKANKEKGQETETKEMTAQEELEVTKKELRELQAALNDPTKKRIRAGINKKGQKIADARKERAQLKPLIDKIAEKKKRRDELAASIGETTKVKQGLGEIDKNASIEKSGRKRNIKAEVEVDGKKKKKTIATEQDYAFEAVGMEGTITERKESGAPSLYYASAKQKVRVKDKDGKTKVVEKEFKTEGAESPAEAIRELRWQAPRYISQTEAKDIVNHRTEGEQISSSTSTMVTAAHDIPNVVRTELKPVEEVGGRSFRRMQIFISDGKGGSSLLTTIFTTPRGKAFAIGKQGKFKGKPVNIDNNKALQQFPEVLAVIKNPKAAKLANSRSNNLPETDHKKDNPFLAREWAQTVQAKINKAKVKPPKGALRTVGLNDVWNASLEAANLVIEAGGNLADALRAGFRHIRPSKWYKALEPSEQEVQEALLRKSIEKVYTARFPKIKKEDIDKMSDQEFARMKKEEAKTRNNAGTRAIFDRRARLSTEAFRTNNFIMLVNTQTNPKEREILPFIIEKTGVPKELNRPDLEKAYENRDVKKLEGIAKQIREHNNRIWDLMTEGAAENSSPEMIEDYITHIWDIPENKKTQVVSHFTQNNRWAKERYINTLEEGISMFGLKPKMLDVSEIMSIHGSMAANVAANREMVQNLKKLRVGGKKMVLQKTNTTKQKGWVEFDEMKGWLVDPNLARGLRPVFGKKVGQDNKLISAYEQANSFVKGMQLTFSLFHHGALAESSVGLMGFGSWKPLLKTAGQTALRVQNKLFGKNTESQVSLPYSFQNKDISEDALRHGLQLGASMDIRVQEMKSAMANVDKAFRWAGGKVGVGKKGMDVALFPVKALDKTLDANNVFLWDYLHDNLKLMAYEQKVEKIPAKYNTPELVEKYKIEMAQVVNDSFGGQNFDVLGATPLAMQMSRWALLSPDWTISTIRQAAPVVLGLPYIGAKAYGAITGNKAAEAAIAKLSGAQFTETAGARFSELSKYWVRVFAIFGAVYNTWNAWKRKEDMEENPDLYTKEELEDPLSLTMWGNTLGHQTHVFNGRYEDGTERYERVGKQFRELPELFMDESPELSLSVGKPLLKKFGGKLAPLPQMIITGFTGKSGSGYENYDMKDKESWAWTGAYLNYLGKAVLPFSTASAFRDDKEFIALDLVFPSSKGMSMSKGIKLIQGYMAKDEPEKMIKVMTQAARNNLNVPDMWTAALSGYKAGLTKEIGEVNKQINDVTKSLQNPNLSSAETKALTSRLSKLIEDEWQLELGVESIVLNMLEWHQYKIDVGNLTPRDEEAVEKAADIVKGRKKDLERMIDDYLKADTLKRKAKQ